MRLLFLILGMTAVTYLPRMAPLVFLRRVRLPPYVRRFLTLLPACAIGALIAPDFWQSVPGHPEAAVAGLVVAGIVAYVRGGLLASVVAGTGASYLLLLISS